MEKTANTFQNFLDEYTNRREDTGMIYAMRGLYNKYVEPLQSEVSRLEGLVVEYQERVATLYTQDELLEAFEAGSSFASEYERGHRGKDYKAFKKELDAYRASLSPPPAKQQEPAKS